GGCRGARHGNGVVEVESGPRVRGGDGGPAGAVPVLDKGPGVASPGPRISCGPAVGRGDAGRAEELALPLGGRPGRPAGAVPGFGQGLVYDIGAAEIGANGHAEGQRGARDAVQAATVISVGARHDRPARPVPRLNEGGQGADTVQANRGAGGLRDAGHSSEEVLVGAVPLVGTWHNGPRGAVPELGKGLVV